MANKEKLLANAQKFISKGQIPKAIGEYQTLVNAFPKDVRNRQKLAELLSRANRNDEALEEYEAVAKHYTDTGFYLKSIAVFKQMQKIDPSRVDIYHSLAELNEKQGLIGNALTEYRNLVSFYDKNKMPQEAIGVLEKMLELDPENLNAAAKVAECYMASGLKEQAFEKFWVIVEPLVEKGEHTKIIKLFERFMEICPEDGTTRLPLARALINSGFADKAIQILKNLLKHSPEDPEINRCLADAYVAIEDFANARLTLKHLLKQHEGDLDLRAYYVRTCIDAGEAERARDRLEEWKDAFFAAERLAELKDFYEKLDGLLDGDALVVASLSAIYEGLGDTVKLDQMRTPEACTEETVESPDDAALDVVIDDVETLDMTGEADSPDGEVPAFSDREHADHRPAEETAAVGLELDLDLDLDLDVPTLQDDEPAVSAVEPLPQDEIAGASADEEDVEVEVELDLDDMGNFDLEFEVDSAVAEPASTSEETPPETDGDFAAEGFVLAEDVEPADEISVAIATPGELDDAFADVVSLSAEFELDDSELVAHTDDESVLETRLDVQKDFQEDFKEDFKEELRDDSLVDTLMAAEDLELEEVHEAQADVAALESEAEADELLDDIEDIEVLETLDELEVLDDLEEVEELEALEEVEELEDVEELDVLDEVAAADADPSRAAIDFAAALNVDAELEEAQFYLQQGLYDDAERVIQTLMEYRPGLPELQVKMTEISQGRQAAASETESAAFVDLMSDLHDDDLLAATDFLGAFDRDGEAHDDLSQKLVSELDSSDTESHYSLGIAYKEMGLYDDAIAEFEKAAKDPARSIDCLSLTGQCHMEAGETAAALAAFKSGLAHKDLTDEGRMTLNFELGMLHQLNGELLEALERFQLVAEKDSFFREVADHIKNLRKELGLEDSDDDGGPQGNRDRVSYI